MKNYMKQKVNNVSKESEKGRRSETRSARPSSGRKQKMSDHILELAENAQKRVDRNFGALLAKLGMRNIDMLNEAYPAIRDEQHMSKLVSGDQHVNLKILVVLHYVFGVDLNEFIAGDTSSQPRLPLDIQKAIDLLVSYLGGC